MNRYVLTTLGYGLTALLGVVGIFASVPGNWLLLVISILIVMVSLDNFFCGSHARACGYSVRGHYVIPPFLEKKDIKRDDAHPEGYGEEEGRVEEGAEDKAQEGALRDAKAEA